MSENKNKFSFATLVKKSDLFSSSLDFSFQGYHYYGTNGGCIFSSLIVLFVIFFGFRLVSGILDFHSYTSMTTIIKTSPDSYLNLNEINTEPITNSIEEIFNHDFDIKFGFSIIDKKTNTFIPYDPSFFIINGFSKNKSISQLSYKEKCNENFFHLEDEQYKNLKIYNSICFFSEFSFSKTFSSPDFEGFYIKLNLCKNKTQSYVDIKDLPSFKRLNNKLKKISEEDSTSTLDNSTIKINEVDSKIKSSNENVYGYFNSNFSNINIHTLNNEIIKADKIENTTDLICKNQNDIDYMVSNVKIRVYFDNFSSNLTNYLNPIYKKFSYFDIELDRQTTKEKIEYFINTTILTQRSVIPESLNSDFTEKVFQEHYSSSSLYFLLKNKTGTPAKDYTAIIKSGMEDLDNEGDMLLKLVISMFEFIKIIKRTYSDIFTIMGTIGGLSRFLMIIIYFLLSYYISTRKKEALINELISLRKEDTFYGKTDNTALKIIGKQFKKVDYKCLQECFNHLKKIYKDKGYEKFEKDFEIFEELYIRHKQKTENIKKNFSKSIINEEDIDIKNKSSIRNENNSINDDSDEIINEFNYNDEEVQDIQQNLEKMYTNSYVDVSCETGKFYDFWKVADHVEDKRLKEFYNRIILRALIKFFFEQKSKFYDMKFNDEEIIEKIQKKKNSNMIVNNFTFEDAEKLFDENKSENEKTQEFVQYLFSQYVNDIEYNNYFNIYETISKKKLESYKFNFIWLHFMYCFKRCTTKKYQKYMENFDHHFDEIIDQSEFSNIYNSIQEFKRFKKIFLEKGQLFMFDSCPNKVINNDTDDLQNTGEYF